VQHEVQTKDNPFWSWVIGIVVLAAVIGVAAKVTADMQPDDVHTTIEQQP